jgi:hypothetical protein
MLYNSKRNREVNEHYAADNRELPEYESRKVKMPSISGSLS